MSPDGKRLAVTQMDGSVWLVDPQTLAVVRKAPIQKGALLAASFSPDGKLLAVTGEHARVTLLNAETLQPVRRLAPLPGRSSQAVTFSPDGRLVASAALVAGKLPDLAGIGRVWDVRSGKATSVRMKVSGSTLSFSPDGRYLAGDGAEAAGGKAEVYDVRTGKRVAKIPTDDIVRSVAFSHDGRLLAVGVFGGSVALVSTADWKPTGRRLAGHSARVTAVEFSPDDRTLLTGSADGTARLWDVGTRRPLGTAMAIKPDSFVAAAFSRSGSHVFAIPSEGPAVRWDIRPDAWKRHACLIGGRDLTRAEWHEMLPDRAYRQVCG
jgi:WD40 repeat protein